jgi:hypothetical protein
MDEDDEKGWVEWAGGEPPVPPRAKVEVKYRNGITGVYRASQLGPCWRDDADPYDIVAYKVLAL